MEGVDRPIGDVSSESLNPIRDGLFEPVGEAFGAKESDIDAVYRGTADVVENGAEIAAPFAKAAQPLAAATLSYTEMAYAEADDVAVVSYTHAEVSATLRPTTKSILAEGAKDVAKDKAYGWGADTVAGATTSDKDQAEGEAALAEVAKEIVSALISSPRWRAGGTS